MENYKNIFSEVLQEKFLEMKCNSIAKNNFEAMSPTDFRAKYLPIYKTVSAVTILALLSSFIDLHVRK